MNERMTKRDADGQAMMDCEKCKADWTGKHGKPMADCTALYCRNRLLGRVVEYEDTGWTPKEVTALGELFNYALKESKTLTEQLTLLKHIRELAEADKDGHVSVLPCKPRADMINKILPGSTYLMERVHFAVAYVNKGNIYLMTQRTFEGGVKNGTIVSAATERALQEMEGKKDGKT